MSVAECEAVAQTPAFCGVRRLVTHLHKPEVFTGGVGVADPWTGNAESGEYWRDSHYQLEDQAVPLADYRPLSAIAMGCHHTGSFDNPLAVPGFQRRRVRFCPAVVAVQHTQERHGTKVVANASKHAANSYGKAGELITTLETEIIELLVKAETADTGDDGPPWFEKAPPDRGTGRAQRKSSGLLLISLDLFIAQVEVREAHQAVFPT